MPRAVWTGALSFGLVSIPVSLYPATSPKDVRFHLFDRQGRRVRYRRVAEDQPPWESSVPPTDQDDGGDAPSHPAPAGPPDAEPEDVPTRQDAEDAGAAPADEPPPGRELEFGDLVRGYEVEPGRFAMLEHAEIEVARPARSSTIDLEDFVELDDIDPVYFEKTYYLVPRRDAAKPYRLLQATLARTRRVGIGRFVLRTKPHLVAVRPTDDALALQTLFFGDEVRRASDVMPRDELAVAERELEIAEQLVGMLATDWEPERYADHYRQELLRIISEKTPADAPEAPTPQRSPSSPGVEELMEALKRSVEEAKAKPRKPKRTPGQRAASGE